ncbi:MAG: adenosine deaminase [Anaerolineales bacterium]
MDKSANFYQRLPKIDLHRHLEGSMRLNTMLEIARTHGITVPIGTSPFSNLIGEETSEPDTVQNFLAKFNTLRMFYRSPEIIHRVTREAIEDAVNDNVRHLELRFAPVALSRAERFPLGQVMDWVCESASEAAQEFGVRVLLIASVNRHESVELAEQVAWLAAARTGNGILGLDLAGNEAEFPAAPFVGIFKEAQQSGLKLTIHAGEWAGAADVREAMETFNADRIGQGVRVMEDPQTTAMARERKTAFEVCLTSNLQTGVFPSMKEHPIINMLKAGINVTLGSDDPSILQITLSDEYQGACEDLRMEHKTLKERILAAAQASFLPKAECDILVEQLGKELSI